MTSCNCCLCSAVRGEESSVKIPAASSFVGESVDLWRSPISLSGTKGKTARLVMLESSLAYNNGKYLHLVALLYLRVAQIAHSPNIVAVGSEIIATISLVVTSQIVD
jgi:hypothetical protein